MKLKNWLIWSIFALLIFIPLTALLQPGMYRAHDSESHVVRLASFYQSLAEGNLIPRWAQDLNAGYGHPILMFLYPLSNYLGALFHFLGFNFFNSIKLVFASGYLAAGAFMYLWLKKHFSNSAALIGTAVFQLAPYRFVNLYVRAAIGENTAFAFMPLVLLCFYSLIHFPSRRRLVIAALALAGLILSHNAVSLMFLPFLFLYALILLFSQPKRLLVTCCLLFVAFLGFALSAFFWLPAMIEGKYTLRDIVMAHDSYATHFSALKQLIIPHWGYSVSYSGTDDDLSLQIGLIQIASFIFGLFFWFKQKHLLALISLIYFLLSSFLMLPLSLPLWRFIPLIKNFQFPWRLLILPVFTSGILAAFVIQRLRQPLLVVIILITLLFQNHRYWQPQGELLPPEQELISSYLGTTDTGESSPIWAVRFQEQRASETLGVVWGAPITYEIITRQSEVHEQTITTTVKTQVSENTLYFPGWTVYVDGKKENIIWTDANWRGVITYPVSAGTHRVRVIFKETKLRLAANWLSLISLCVAILLFVF